MESHLVNNAEANISAYGSSPASAHQAVACRFNEKTVVILICVEIIWNGGGGKYLPQRDEMSLCLNISTSITVITPL